MVDMELIEWQSIRKTLLFSHRIDDVQVRENGLEKAIDSTPLGLYFNHVEPTERICGDFDLSIIVSPCQRECGLFCNDLYELGLAVQAVGSSSFLLTFHFDFL